MAKAHSASACETCPANARLEQMGLKLDKFDRVVALAGNPNTGKSTVFNALTGLNQHTGNWPGKTVMRAEGGYEFNNIRYKLVDLPGTYSLLSASQDEEVARNFILFGQPDCTVVVTDATALERNLNLALQVMEITDKVVVAVNLMDEARRKGITVDVRSLSRDLGVPAIPITARTGEGLQTLLSTIGDVISGEIQTKVLRVEGSPELQKAISTLSQKIEQLYPGIPNARWLAIRLLDGDSVVQQAILSGEIAELVSSQRRAQTSFSRQMAVEGRQQDTAMNSTITPQDIIDQADALRPQLSGGFRDDMVKSLYSEVERITNRAVKVGTKKKYDFDQRIDRLVTSPIFGLPLMLLLLAAVFWITIVGANVPSAMLAKVLFFVEDQAAALFTQWGIPWWITGFIWHGVYRGLAWVVSVMLPPMAIFFPIFTILEDLGYLPRVAFNLDFLFKRAGAHGKQSLTMAMGFGCNAAGVIATRVIDSPRERLIAILTNNFVPCNGRFPTLILLATIFVAASFPPAFASFAAAGAVVGVVLIGVFFTLLVSWALSKTLLKGEASAFTLELPPYRRPNVMRILYTSLIDRTVFVLSRALLTAAPAGAVIWILANINVAGVSLAQHTANFLDPFGFLLGLDGVILLAYIIAIPANEIVVPTMMMVYMGVGMMTDPPDMASLRDLLVVGHGWTMLTAINLMLFSLLHNPCATTIMTIYKETKSYKWATLSVVITLGLAFLVTFLTATIARMFFPV